MPEQIPANREPQGAPEQQPPKLEHALRGVSLFLKLSPDEQAAMAAHFLTGESTDVSPARRARVVARVGELFAGYFGARRHFMMVPTWDKQSSLEQKRMKMQQSLVALLVGDSQNAVTPSSLAAIIRRHPNDAARIARIAHDAFAGMLEFYAERHRFTRTQLLGRVSVAAAGTDVEEAGGFDGFDEAYEPVSVGREYDSISPPVWDETQMRLSWAPIAAMSAEAGQLPQEHDDPDWQPGSLLRIPHPGAPSHRAFADALDHRLLDQDEVLELVARIRIGQAALRSLYSGEEMTWDEQEEYGQDAILGLRAKGILAYHHLRLALSVAISQSRDLVDLNDTIQGGMIGLMRATERFDPFFVAHAEGRTLRPDEPTMRFSTLAVLEVKRYASRANTEALSKIVAQGMNLDDREHIRRNQEENVRLGNSITLQESARQLGISEGVFQKLFSDSALIQSVSLDHLRDQYGEFEAVKGYTDSALAAVEADVSQSSFWRTIRARAGLTSREYEALARLYALGMDNGATAVAMGVTHQRVTQLEAAALRKLRSLGGIPESKVSDDEPFSLVLRKMRIWLGPEDNAEAIRTWLFQISHETAFDDGEREIIHLSFGLGRHNGYRQTPEVVEALGLDANRVKWVRRKFLAAVRSRNLGK